MGCWSHTRLGGLGGGVRVTSGLDVGDSISQPLVDPCALFEGGEWMDHHGTPELYAILQSVCYAPEGILIYVRYALEGILIMFNGFPTPHFQTTCNSILPKAC